ncbi:MAG TPA: putative glycoside hydrolase [Candidatus Binatia bacterium]|nr:putative glycoside hydrolase [Candidatus Binatia bacterium]
MAVIALAGTSAAARAADGSVALTLSGTPSSPMALRALRVASAATTAVRFRAPATTTLAAVLLPFRRLGTDCTLELAADAAGALGDAIASAPIAGAARWVATPLRAALAEGRFYHLVTRCRGQSGLMLYVNDAAGVTDVWSVETIRSGAVTARPAPATPLFALVFADGTWWGQPYTRREMLAVCDARMVQATIVPAKTMSVTGVVVGGGVPGEGDPLGFTLTARDGTALLASPRPGRGAAAATAGGATLVAGETYGLRLETAADGHCVGVPGLTSDLPLGRATTAFDPAHVSVSDDGGATWTPRPSRALAVTFVAGDAPSTTTTASTTTVPTSTAPTTSVTTTTRPTTTTTATTARPPATATTSTTATPTTTVPRRRSTATVVAAKDAFITSPANPGSNYGGWAQAWIGRDGVNVERALLGFDLSGLPPAATVLECRLAVTVQDVHGTPGPGHVFALAKDWTERGVTWTSTGAGPWTAPGALADVAGAVAYPAPSAPGAFSFPDLTALCQDAITSRGGRLALLVRQDDESRPDEVSIATRESTTGARPTLTVTVAGDLPSTTTTTTTSTTVTTTTRAPRSDTYKSIYASGYLGSYDKSTIPVWPQRLGIILGGQSLEGAMLAQARKVAVAAGNEDVKFIYYFSMTDMDSRCQCFDQFFYDSFRGAHPEWILRDANGNQVSTVNGIGRVYAIDIGNPALVDAWADWAMKGMDQYGWDGVFADNVARGVFSEWSAWPINPRTRQPYTVPDWRRDILAALQRIQAKFHARGKLFVGNHSQAWQPDTFSDPIVQNEVLTMDGVEIEDCVYNYDGTPHTEAEWIAQLRYLDFANRHGVRTLCSGSTSGAIGDPSKRMFMLATYLLTKEGFSLISELNTLSDWWPDLAMDLGQPSGGYVCLDPGAGFAPTSSCPSTGKVYRRAWQKGLALANPTPSSTFTVPLGGTYLNHGTPVTSVTLGPRSGVVLTKP